MISKKKILFSLSFFYTIILAFYLNKNNLNHLKENFLSTSSVFYFVILIFIFLNFGILALRLMLSYHMFGCKISFKDSFRISFASQIGSLFFVPFIGNMIGQVLASQKIAISNNVVLLIALFERLIIFLSGLIVCTVSCLLLYKSDSIIFIKNNHSVIQILCLLVLSSLYLFYFLLSKYEKKAIKQIISLKNISYIFVIFILGISTWLSMAGVYSLALYILLANTQFMAVFQSATIVTFISSLPISINGWGVREIAAMEIFKLQGVPENKSLFVAMSIGLLSILSLIFIIIARKINTYFQSYRRGHETTFPNLSSEIQMHDKKDLSFGSDRLIVGALCYFLSILIFFNIYVSFKNYHLNVSPADVFGLLGLVMLSVNIYTKKINFEFIIPQFNRFILLTSIAFLVSSIISFHKFGFTDWAFINKFFGWYILIGYTAMGMFFSYYFGHRGIDKIINLMIFILGCIILEKIILQYLAFYELLPPSFLQRNFSGFSQNRNAFGCQIISIVCLFIIKNKYYFSTFKNWKTFLPVGILYFGSFLTFSKTAQISSLLILSFLSLLKIIDTKALFNIFFITFGIWILNFFIINGINLGFQFSKIVSNFSSIIFDFSFIFGEYSLDTSDTERWYSILEGLKLWWQHPFFGIGLGGFLSQQILDHHRHLIIHNTFVWLLVEFGLFGFSIFGYYGILIGKYCYALLKDRFKSSCALTFDESGFICIIFIFILFSIPHDVMYQRIFWFLAGLIITKKFLPCKTAQIIK